jgi:ubiquinone/menaquinone biosynthesis C-methylase UbiE
MPSGTTFCDIAGGIGSVAMPLAEAHPHLKLTLQDQPSVIEQARDVGGVLSPFWHILNFVCAGLE